MSLIKLLQDQLTPTLLATVAGRLGESEAGVSKGLMGLLPTLLAGMVNKAGSPSGLDGLFGMLSKPETATYLDNLSGMVGSGNLAHGDPRDVAGNLVGQLFGDKVGPILTALAGYAALKDKGSAGGLLGLAGPLVMGVLSKKIKTDGLSVAGFKDLLMAQRHEIQAAVPPVMATAAGLPVVAKTSAASTPVAEERRSSAGWLLWLLPLLGLGLLAWSLLRDHPEPGVVTTPTDEVEVAAPAGTDVAMDPVTDEGLEMPAAETVDREATELAVAVPGIDLAGIPNGVEAELVEFIQSDREPCTEPECWFTLDRVTFETGSANIDMAKSEEQLSNLKLIMDAYPSLQLKFGGYTDNTGSADTNKALSQSRADAIAAALTALGVDQTRMGAEGYGPEFPVATNDTEEGRAQNRRIDVRVRSR